MKAQANNGMQRRAISRSLIIKVLCAPLMPSVMCFKEIRVELSQAET